MCLRERSREHWLKLLTENGIPTGEFHSVEELVSHPQIEARRMITEVRTRGDGKLSVAGNPLSASQTQSLVRRQPPELDADREHILRELDQSRLV